MLSDTSYASHLWIIFHDLSCETGNAEFLKQNQANNFSYQSRGRKVFLIPDHLKILLGKLLLVNVRPSNVCFSF